MNARLNYEQPEQADARYGPGPKMDECRRGHASFGHSDRRPGGYTDHDRGQWDRRLGRKQARQPYDSVSRPTGHGDFLHPARDKGASPSTHARDARSRAEPTEPKEWAHGFSTRRALPSSPRTDFKRALQAVTRLDQNQYGIAGNATNHFALTHNSAYSPIWRVPNNGRLDPATGKLTKDVETDEFKAAVGFSRDLWQSGLWHPNYGGTYNDDFMAGRLVFAPGVWGQYVQLLDIEALRQPDACSCS